MKKVVHHLTRSTRILLILAAVLVALLMTSARILLPLVEDYHHDLESQLSRQIGKPVRVGELRAHLRGFYPELVLKEVSVLSPDQKVTAARLKEVRVGLSLSSFFKSAAVRPLWVTLIGAELTVTREKDGALSVYGLGSGKKKSEFPHWLFENGRFEVLESRLFWQNLKINGPIVELQNLHASLLNDEGRHQLNIEAALPEEKGRSLAIKMDYRGDIALADQWQGTVYLEGVGIFPAKILAGEQFEAFDIEKGRVDFKIWSEWKEASIKAVQGDLKLSDPAVSWQLEKTGHREKLALKLFSGLFRLKMAENGWNLAATELVVTRNGESRQQKEAVTIDYQNDSVRIAGSFLNLAEIRDLLLESSLLKKEQAELLFGTAPSGHLTDFSVVAQLAEGEFKGGWFCGRFNKIKLEAWRKVPGVENFEGRFCGSERQGFVELGTGNAQINLASLFRTPWQISNNQGRIHWQKQQQGWRLFSDGFAVETPDIKTVTRFDLVFEEGKSPFIDLQSTFQEGIVANAGFYYPVKVMPNHVVSWLDQALVSGEVISGGARLYGRLGEFPFSKNEGVFEVLFDVKNTQLNYQKSWPPLTDIGAEVRFYQDDLVISADQAVLEGEQVEWAEVSIKGLRHAQWINIS